MREGERETWVITSMSFLCRHSIKIDGLWSRQLCLRNAVRALCRALARVEGMESSVGQAHTAQGRRQSCCVSSSEPAEGNHTRFRVKGAGLAS